MSDNMTLDKLFQEFEAYRLSHPLIGDPDSLYEPMEYIMGLGGKRLRPILCLAICQAFGGKTDDALPAALGIEVFHNFSLVHDDIMDEAPIRRGKETVHKKWDLNAAILSGDAMLVKAYQLIAQCPEAILPSVLKSFNEMASRLCEGQRLDMDFERMESVSEEDYLLMIEGKTSVLIGCAMEIGALIGGSNKEQASSMYEFGLKLGLAFQIKDDYLDCFGDSALTGKQSGGDILAGKHTLLAIHAKQTNELAFSNVMKQNGQQRVDSMMELFTSSGTDKYVIDKSEALLKESIDALRLALPEDGYRVSLEELASKLVHREF
jgi:geranylgeranyl diphosphate synthase type II